MAAEKKEQLEQVQKVTIANPSNATIKKGYEKKEQFQQVPIDFDTDKLLLANPSDAVKAFKTVQKTNKGEREVSEEMEKKALSNAEVLQRMKEASSGKESGEYGYLVRGALLKCQCGSHRRRVNLPLCHGVYFGKNPVLSNYDCIVGDDDNIRAFGICNSANYPAKGPTWGEKALNKMVGRKFNEEIMLVAEDGSNIIGYPCIPRIIGDWKKPTNETKFPEEGESAITMQSFLVCAYGGWISPETNGKEYKD